MASWVPDILGKPFAQRTLQLGEDADGPVVATLVRSLPPGLLRMLGPGGMGGGDVKLAGVLGIALGWVGWGALAVGAVAGFVLGGVYGVMLIALRRASAKTAVPFGPWMLAGAWIGILFGEDLGHRLLTLPV